MVEQGEIFRDRTMGRVESLRSDDNMLAATKSRRARGRWAEGCRSRTVAAEKARRAVPRRLQVFVSILVPCSHDGDGLSLLLEAGCRRRRHGRRRELLRRSHATKWLAPASSPSSAATTSNCGRRRREDRRHPLCRLLPGLRVLYEKNGTGNTVEVVHITRCWTSVKEGSLRLRSEVPMTVTYHDPCHLGRLADPWFTGTEYAEGRRATADPRPPKRKRCGALGVYDAPRELLRRDPRATLVEMHRIREYGLVLRRAEAACSKSVSGFATGRRHVRVDEARSVGAEALVTRCAGGV